MITINKSQIELLAWLKNNHDWYVPEKRSPHLDINEWKHYEIIHFHNYQNFLVYCWNDNKAEDGRLFKAMMK